MAIHALAWIAAIGAAMSVGASRLFRRRGGDPIGKSQRWQRPLALQEADRVVYCADAFLRAKPGFARQNENVSLKSGAQFRQISGVNFRMLAGPIHLTHHGSPGAGGDREGPATET